MQRKLQIFISSTFTDLIDERQAAVEAVLEAGHIPAGMELFAAGDKSQLDVIRAWIEESDALLLILGGRYGSIEPDSGKSYVEVEYDHATSLDKPVFAAVMKEDAIESRVRALGSGAIETDNKAALKAFREKVLARISKMFADQKDLKLIVHQSLGRIATDPRAIGWVKASEVTTIQDLREQIVKLTIRATEQLNRPAQSREGLISKRIELEKMRQTCKFPSDIEKQMRIDALIRVVDQELKSGGSSQAE